MGPGKPGLFHWGVEEIMRKRKSPAKRKGAYGLVLVRTSPSGARTSRIASWALTDFNNLTTIEDDCELAGEIRSAVKRFEREEAS